MLGEGLGDSEKERSMPKALTHKEGPERKAVGRGRGTEARWVDEDKGKRSEGRRETQPGRSPHRSPLLTHQSRITGTLP